MSTPNPKKAEIWPLTRALVTSRGIILCKACMCIYYTERFNIDLSTDDLYRTTTITNQCTIAVKSGPAFAWPAWPVPPALLLKSKAAGWVACFLASQLNKSHGLPECECACTWLEHTYTDLTTISCYSWVRFTWASAKYYCIPYELINFFVIPIAL